MESYSVKADIRGEFNDRSDFPELEAPFGSGRDRFEAILIELAKIKSKWSGFRFSLVET